MKKLKNKILYNLSFPFCFNNGDITKLWGREFFTLHQFYY